VALTFDDGPSRRSTPLVFDFLAEHHVHATFFLLGRELAKDRASMSSPPPATRRRATAESVAATVTQIPAAGGTILLHDSDACSAPNSWVSTLGALPTLLAHWQDQNLKVGPLHEHGHTP